MPSTKPLIRETKWVNSDEPLKEAQVLWVTRNDPTKLEKVPDSFALNIRTTSTLPTHAQVEGLDALVLDECYLDDPHIKKLVDPALTRNCRTVALVSSFTGSVLSHVSNLGFDGILAAPFDFYRLSRLWYSGENNGSKGPLGAHASVLVVGSNGALMQTVWNKATLAAQVSDPVLIGGETGVGKEVVAKLIHRFSSRRNGPFVAVNCAAIPEALLESELFGHEKGAFTGAHQSREGRFKRADGGTLFLDEVGDFPMSLQVKLLRVLQEQTFEPVGSSETLHVNVRIIAASHRNIEEMVSKNEFRSDLYYRLNVLSLVIPPIRERRDDILPLWKHFLASGANPFGPNQLETSSSAERVLLQHDWPGNVREIANAAAYARAMSLSRTLLPADLPSMLDKSLPARSAPSSFYGLTLDDVEYRTISERCATSDSVKAAAVSLGISERTLHYRLRLYEEQGRPVTHSGARSASNHVSKSKAPRIFVVEDDEDLRKAIADYLTHEGCTVVEAQDGEKTVSRLGALVSKYGDNGVDLVVADVRMPLLGGFELLGKLRELNIDVPVVLMSGTNEQWVRDRAKHCGATDFLPKPIDLERLWGIVQNLPTHK